MNYNLKCIIFAHVKNDQVYSTVHIIAVYSNVLYSYRNVWLKQIFFEPENVFNK